MRVVKFLFRKWWGLIDELPRAGFSLLDFQTMIIIELIIFAPVFAAVFGIFYLLERLTGIPVSQEYSGILFLVLIAAFLAVCVAQVVHTNRRVRREVYGRGDAYKRRGPGKKPSGKEQKSGDADDPWNRPPETPPWE